MILKYIREKRYTLFFFFLSAAFSGLLIWSGRTSGSSLAVYLAEGLLIFFVLYLVVDYFNFRSRIQTMITYLQNGAMQQEEFSYPSDQIFADEACRMAKQFNGYQSDTLQRYAEDIDFVTRWVHDIKVPISALYLMIDGLEEEDQKEALEMQISYIEQYTQRILYHVKAKSFQDDYKITRTQTKKIIASALKPYATFFSHKEIVLSMDAADCTVSTDEKWSVYILSQFLSNAVKYTPQQGTITIYTKKSEDSVSICVRNTGDGIEAERLRYVFDKGFTAFGDRADSKATGYGLYLAKMLAERMGHRLTVCSVPQEYAEFCLSFPRESENLSTL